MYFLFQKHIRDEKEVVREITMVCSAKELGIAQRYIRLWYKISSDPKEYLSLPCS